MKTIGGELGSQCRSFVGYANFSPMDLSDSVHSMLENILLPAGSIEFENTEGRMMDENPITQQNLEKLRIRRSTSVTAAKAGFMCTQ